MGIGASWFQDKEVLSVTAAEAVLTTRSIRRDGHCARREECAVDLRSGERRAIQVARLTPAAAATPVHHVFHASFSEAWPRSTPSACTPHLVTRSREQHAACCSEPSRPRRILLVRRQFGSVSSSVPGLATGTGSGRRRRKARTSAAPARSTCRRTRGLRAGHRLSADSQALSA